MNKTLIAMAVTALFATGTALAQQSGTGGSSTIVGNGPNTATTSTTNTNTNVNTPVTTTTNRQYADHDDDANGQHEEHQQD